MHNKAVLRVDISTVQVYLAGGHAAAAEAERQKDGVTRH